MTAIATNVTKQEQPQEEQAQQFKAPQNIKPTSWRDEISEHKRKNLFSNIVLELQKRCTVLPHYCDEECKRSKCRTDLVYEQYASKLIKKNWKTSDSCLEFLNRVMREIKQLAISGSLQEIPTHNSTLTKSSKVKAEDSHDVVHLLRKDFQCLYRHCKVMERKLKQRERTEQMMLDLIGILREQVADLQSRVPVSETVKVEKTKKRSFDEAHLVGADEQEVADMCGGNAEICTFSATSNSRHLSDEIMVGPPKKRARTATSEQPKLGLDKQFVEVDINM